MIRGVNDSLENVTKALIEARIQIRGGNAFPSALYKRSEVAFNQKLESWKQQLASAARDNKEDPKQMEQNFLDTLEKVSKDVIGMKSKARVGSDIWAKCKKIEGTIELSKQAISEPLIGTIMHHKLSKGI